MVANSWFTDDTTITPSRRFCWTQFFTQVIERCKSPPIEAAKDDFDLSSRFKGLQLGSFPGNIWSNCTAKSQSMSLHLKKDLGGLCFFLWVLGMEHWLSIGRYGFFQVVGVCVPHQRAATKAGSCSPGWWDMCCLKPHSPPRHSTILFRWLLFRPAATCFLKFGSAWFFQQPEIQNSPNSCGACTEIMWTNVSRIGN